MTIPCGVAIKRYFSYAVHVVVQFRPWFNFHCHILAWKIKIEPRIKLNYNIYKVGLAFESVDEILQWGHTNESY